MGLCKMMTSADSGHVCGGSQVGKPPVGYGRRSNGQVSPLIWKERCEQLPRTRPVGRLGMRRSACLPFTVAICGEAWVTYSQSGWAGEIVVCVEGAARCLYSEIVPVVMNRMEVSGGYVWWVNILYPNIRECPQTHQQDRYVANHGDTQQANGQLLLYNESTDMKIRLRLTVTISGERNWSMSHGGIMRKPERVHLGYDIERLRRYGGQGIHARKGTVSVNETGSSSEWHDDTETMHVVV
nr:hypothetical protein Iba_chr08eCG3670 [Ipomoea batatas]